MIELWATARATPAPSEFSESASEYSDDNPEHTIHRRTPTTDDGQFLSSMTSLEELSLHAEQRTEPFLSFCQGAGSQPSCAAPEEKHQTSPERRWADIVKT